MLGVFQIQAVLPVLAFLFGKEHFPTLTGELVAIDLVSFHDVGFVSFRCFKSKQADGALVFKIIVEVALVVLGQIRLATKRLPTSCALHLGLLCRCKIK